MDCVRRALLSAVVVLAAGSVAGCQSVAGEKRPAGPLPSTRVEQKEVPAQPNRPKTPPAPPGQIKPELPPDRPVEDLPTEPVPAVLARA